VPADDDDGPAVRVVICDDHELFRRGLSMVLGGTDGIEVVGVAADGAEAVGLVERHEPDVVLLDVRMPGTDGIAAARAIVAGSESVRVLMLTVSDAEEDLYESVKAGAHGYLLKDVGTDELLAAIRAVVAGQSLISPPMAAKLLAEFNVLARAAEARATGPQLTEREREVLALLARSRSNRAIAEELGIAENTVKNHVRGILEKLGMRSRVEVVVHALREGLVDLD
jgi:two-component system NarL family response regulator